MQSTTDRGYIERQKQRVDEAEAAELRKRRDADELYLAAHAPHEVPTWFKPVMPAKPVAPANPFSTETSTPFMLAKNYMSDRFNMEYEVRAERAAFRLSDAGAEALMKFAAEVDDYVSLERAWMERYVEERIIQWPWHWARSVLAVRGLGR